MIAFALVPDVGIPTNLHFSIIIMNRVFTKSTKLRPTRSDKGISVIIPKVRYARRKRTHNRLFTKNIQKERESVASCEITQISFNKGYKEGRKNMWIPRSKPLKLIVLSKSPVNIFNPDRRPRIRAVARSQVRFKVIK